MSPIIEKALYRIKKIKRPPIFGGDSGLNFSNMFRRGFVALLITFLVIGIIYSGRVPIRVRLSEGDIATEDIYAPYSFTYEYGIDEDEMLKRREEAVKGVIDRYELDSSVYDRTKIEVEAFFKDLSAARLLDTEEIDSSLEAIISKYSLKISSAELKRMVLFQNMELLKNEILTIIEKLYQNPLVLVDAKSRLMTSFQKMVLLINPSQKSNYITPVDQILSIKDAPIIISNLFTSLKIEDSVVSSALTKIVVSNWTRPNTTFNFQATESAKKEALSMVEHVYNVLKRSKGEIIIRKGQMVTIEHVIQLTKICPSFTKENIFAQFFSIMAIISLIAFLTLAYLKYIEPKIFRDDKLMFLTGIIILLSSLSSKVVISSPISSYFIPIAAIGMLLTLLINGRVAVIGVMAASIIAALIAGAKFNVFLVSIVGGITAICTIYRTRNRGQLLKSGMYVGVLNFVTIGAIGILSNLDIKLFVREGLWGVGNGFLSVAITMLLLPIFESLFKLTTDIKLLELSDLNHPLLKKMIMNADGTYHHSIIVGNLAESACDAIGANSLLARVGAYYHDIGKIEKSEYFAENRRDSLDMHKSLSPSMSSLIITNHVKDGVELAEKYKLSNAIKDIIEQHHGTGLVTYFFHQAIEKSAKKKDVSEESFRYPGPKPQTKESAIVMIADSVEAASRVLQNPTPLRLKELVRKTINNKFLDRQMDECDLTLKDVNKIAENFVKILTGIYHSRIEYPEN